MDKEVSKALKFNPTTFKVNEIFASIQGEGVNTGAPSIFVRLALCNLSCSRCDSAFSWNWIDTSFEHIDNKKYDPRNEIKEMTLDELAGAIKKLANKNGWNSLTGYAINHVVITGGEPLLHLVNLKNHELFKKLLVILKTYRFHVEIETNGTIIPPDDIVKFVDQFNVSPKLSSFFDTSKSIKTDVLKFFVGSKKAWFKFVITNKQDIKEVMDLQKECNISPNSILLMPEGRTEEVLREKSQDIVKLCMDNGYRFCNRLHVWLWDNKRGV